jgi:hypothetical protein
MVREAGGGGIYGREEGREERKEEEEGYEGYERSCPMVGEEGRDRRD